MVRGLSASQWHEATDSEQLAIDLAAAVENNLAETIKAHGRASLVLSGGSTPLPFFKQLSQASLDWAVIDVTLADERWVPEDHDDSNARFVKEHFLTGAASAARFFSLYRDAEPDMAIGDVHRAIEEMIQPFSVVILGMGADGHTASLFPDTDGLEAALDLNARPMLAVLRPESLESDGDNPLPIASFFEKHLPPISVYWCA